MIREAGESWLCMDYQGQNGFLNVLVCLKWWRDALEDASPDWEDAVDDVTWVLRQMAECVFLPAFSLGSDTSEPGNRDNGSTEEPVAAPTNDAATPGTGGTNTNGNPPRTPVSIGGSQRRSGITVNEVRDIHMHNATAKSGIQNDEAARNRVIPSRTEITRKEGGARPGTEGLSQEELDEMENDSQADMEEDQ
jgi:hypothetical protein